MRTNSLAALAAGLVLSMGCGSGGEGGVGAGVRGHETTGSAGSTSAEAHAPGVAYVDRGAPRATYVVVDAPTIVEEHALAKAGKVHPARRVLYLNRHGGTYRRGYEDSSSGTSSILHGPRVTIPAYAGGGDDDGGGSWDAVLTCVKQEFSRWNVTVTDKDPGDTPHIEAVVGGRPALLGLARNVGGVAPMRRDGSTIETAVVFVFSEALSGPQKTCEVTTHELGHALGLEHAYLCEDPMTYLQGCGHKSFQDVDAWCGEDEPRACHGGGKQNSVRFLDARLGAAEGAEPPPANEKPEPPVGDGDGDGEPTFTIGDPAEGASVSPGDRVTVSVTIAAPAGLDLTRAWATWKSPVGESTHPLRHLQGSTWKATLHVSEAAAAGSRTLRIHARAADGTEWTSSPRKLRVVSSGEGDDDDQDRD